VPELVIAEVTYFIGRRLGWEAEVRFLGDLAGGDFALEPVHAADVMRIAELVARYNGLPLGTVDASVVAVGERLGEHTVATTDRHLFGVVRPSHADAFVLVP
jgi:uncharacterized protein